MFLVDGGGRVGELDEEMVYEARAGQTFLLGASSWRIEEITRDRVLVSPAPGVPGAVPFWKGEGIGRPYELGQKIGAASRELSALSDAAAGKRLRGDYHLDERAARNLLTFLREQQDATGAVPSDRTIVVERFRDEIGDWRVCILSPFGSRVHAPWAMAITARLREAHGVEAQSIWSDDGIALHFPEADAPPPVEDLLVDPGEVEDLVVAEVGETALFGARFRENAGRALLIPRRRPGERTPLWQQRLKAQSLLQVARKYGSFPIILETYRECLQDVFDLPALRSLLQGLKTRELDLVEVETQSASPYSASLLFDYIATYMYEDDTPPAERRAQALSLDRDLLRELLGQEELRDLLDADAVDEVERQLRGTPTSPDQLHDRLRIRGDLRADEYDAELAEPLLADRRAVLVRFAGEERLIAAEDAGRYRDAVGAMPPSGLPDAFLESVPDALRQLVLRFAKGRGPFTTGEASDRFGRDVGELLARARTSRAARARRAATGRQRARVVRPRRAAPACAGRRSRRSGARSSRSTRRRSPASCPGWHGIDRRASLREALVPLQALPLPVALWEAEVLPRRVPAYRPEHLDALTASGEVVWVGAGPDRVALYFREDASALGPGPACRTPGGRRARFGARRPRTRRTLLARPARGDGARRLDRPAGALGSRLGGRGDQRRVDAASRDPPVRAAAGRAPAAAFLAPPVARRDGDGRPLVADRSVVRRPTRPARARRAAARAAGHRHARRRPRRGHPGRATGPSTQSCARSRRSVSAAAGTSPRGSAVRSSRSAAPSSGCASCVTGRSKPTHSCWRPPTRRSRTAQGCRGRAVPARAPPASPAPTSSRSAASPCSTSSAVGVRSSRCATLIRSGCALRSSRWPPT